MSARIHERRQRRDIPTKRAIRRDPLCDRKLKESIADIDRKITIWLLENDPTWKAEKEQSAIYFGSAENREAFNRRKA